LRVLCDAGCGVFRTVTTTSSTPRFGARLASTCAVR
jgi:hypothetical protein